MIEKCSIGNMTNNIQNITLILLILILIIVIIYYLKNSNAKHNELIEKYTNTPTNIIDRTPDISHSGTLTEANRLSHFPTQGTPITLRTCQVAFNNDKTSKYEYQDEWQEIDMLEGVKVPVKIIGRDNTTNASTISNFSEKSRCYKELSSTGTNKYKYLNNDLIQYDKNHFISLTSNINGAPVVKNYMQMKFDVFGNNVNHYDNIRDSICSLNYSTTLRSGSSDSTSTLGNTELYRLKLTENKIIEYIEKITIDPEDNHIFNKDSSFGVANLIAANTGKYKYDTSSKLFIYEPSNASASNDIRTINLYQFERNLFCDKQEIKSYKKLDNAKIDMLKFINYGIPSSTYFDTTTIPTMYMTEPKYSTYISNITKVNSKTDVDGYLNDLITKELESLNTITSNNLRIKRDLNQRLIDTRTNFIEPSNNSKAKFIQNAIVKNNYDNNNTYQTLLNENNYNLDFGYVSYSGYSIVDNDASIKISEVNEPKLQEFISATAVTDDIWEIKTFKEDGALNLPVITEGCDILMIGGGGSGGAGDAGGGGAGACIVAINQTLSAGTYTVRVGKGGEGGSLSSTGVFTKLPTNGSNSSILNQQGNEIFRAVGGGRAGGVESSKDYSASSAFVGKEGGCGGGAGFWQGNNATSGGSASTLNIVNGVSNIGPSVTSTYGVYGNSGGSAQQWTNGNYSTANCGGGGGIGTAGASGTASTNRSGVGGNGLNAVTINRVTYNFSTHFTNGGVFGVDGYIGGGGGGGGYSNSPAKISGGLGGGGTGDCAGSYTTFADAPTNGAPNTGSGGGGGCGNYGANGGDGGSGIVVIRYKKKPVPIDNNVRKKITLEYKEKSYIREFRHSGGTEDQTIYTEDNAFKLPAQATADILIVGGGGGGGFDGGGGGGGGQVLYYTNNAVAFKTGNAITLNAGTYNISVGKGGDYAPNHTVNAINGQESSIKMNNTTVLSAGGGGGGGTVRLTSTGNNAPGGGGGNAHDNRSGSTTGGTSSASGGSGGDNSGISGGGGGGGANITETIKNGGNGTDSKRGDGGQGVNIIINNITYSVGGGGGGGSYMTPGESITSHGGGIGGDGAKNGANGTNGTGGGGGGGGWAGTPTKLPGYGGSGIVIIKYKFANDNQRYRLNFPKSTKVQFIFNGDGNRIDSNNLFGSYIITMTSTKTIIEKEGGTSAQKQEISTTKLEIIYDLYDTLDNINTTFTDSLVPITTRNIPKNIYNNTLSSINNCIPFQLNKYNKYKISGFIPKANKEGDNNINFNIDLITPDTADTSRLITMSKDLYSIRYNFPSSLSTNEIIPIDIYLTIKPIPNVKTNTILYFAFKTYSKSATTMNGSEILVFLGNRSGTSGITNFNNIGDWITNLSNKNIWGLSTMDGEIEDIVNNLLSVSNIDSKCNNDGSRICDIKKLIDIKKTINNTPVSNTGAPSLKSNISIVSQNVFPTNLPNIDYNINDYISYEDSSLKAPQQRTTTFDIKSTAKKYIYFEIPNVSPVR